MRGVDCDTSSASANRLVTRGRAELKTTGINKDQLGNGMCHDVVHQGHTRASIAPAGRELGVRWRALSEPDKIPFAKLAKTDRERYEREVRLNTHRRQLDCFVWHAFVHAKS